MSHGHSPQVPVVGGQGWNVSMQDSYNLAWKLALVIENRASDALLDTYEREREPVSEQVIEGSSSIHEIIMSHGSGLEDRMALTQTDGWNDNAVARISGLSYNYCAAMDIPDGCNVGVKPFIGERLPDVHISPHVRLHQLTSHTRFTLLIILDEGGDAQLASATSIYRLVEREYPALVRVELIAPITPHPWPGLIPTRDEQGAVAEVLNAASGGELILVRPDGYIGCRALLNSARGLAAYLGTIFLSR
ncbi:MAG: FAD-dependent monooxygenase [Proteobacteria bacterium]|nr:FAD-dependent monooxygenase [Pseudomonadota bacterium]